MTDSNPLDATTGDEGPGMPEATRLVNLEEVMEHLRSRGPKFHLEFALSGREWTLTLECDGSNTAWVLGRDTVSSPHISFSGGELKIAIPDTDEAKTISRRHLKLLWSRDSGWEVCNLSANGTRVGDRLLKEQDAASPMTLGTKIEAGKVTFTIAVMDGSNAAREPAPTARIKPKPEPAKRAEDAKVLPPIRETPPIQSTPGIWGCLIENTLEDPRKFDLAKRTVTIGSHPLNNDIVIDDASLSPLYAALKWKGRQLYCESRDSKRPIEINHTQYKTSPPLSDGTIITLGSTQFELKIMGDPPDAIPQEAVRKLRMAAVLAIAGTMILGGAWMYSFKTKRWNLPTDPLSRVAPWTPVGDEEIKAIASHLVQHEGLTGLPLLKVWRRQPGGAAIISEKQIFVMDHLAQVHGLVHNGDDEDLFVSAAFIERTFKEAQSVAELRQSAASAEMLPWIEQLRSEYENRRSKNRDDFWETLLGQLEGGQFANARQTIEQMRQGAKLSPETSAECLQRIGVWQDLLGRAFESDLDPGTIFKLANDPQAQKKLLKQVEALQSELETFLGKKSETQEGDVVAALERSEDRPRMEARITDALASQQMARAFAENKLDEFRRARGAASPEAQAPFARMDRVLASIRGISTPEEGNRLHREAADIAGSRSEVAQAALAAVNDLKSRSSSLAITCIEASRKLSGVAKVLKLIEAYAYNPSAIEPGSKKKLDQLVNEAYHEYEVGFVDQGTEKVRAEKENLEKIRSRLRAADKSSLSACQKAERLLKGL